MRAPRAARVTLVAALLPALAVACAAPSGDAGPDAGRDAGRDTGRVERGAALAQAATGEPADRATTSVLAISVDGLASEALEALGPQGAPALHRLVAEGASTMDARTVVELTETLPNHTSMLTGLRVEAAEGGHGVEHNDEEGGTVHTWAGREVPSVFSVLDEHDRGAALFAMKDKFWLYPRSWPEPIDRFVLEDDEQDLVTAVLADLREQQRALRFVHLAAPDVAGHDHGFGSEEYLAAVAEVDREVGRLLQAVAGTADLAGTTVVLTSDHGGGDGTDHWVADEPANFTVPFVAWGAGVSPGSDLYALNPDRRHPGDDQPGWEGTQPVRNAEVANLVLDLLGLPGVPGADANPGQDLDLR